MELATDNAVRLISPRTTALVTTVDEQGRTNAAPYSWVYPVSFSPPLVGVGIGGKHKHTYKNIEKIKEFVLNIVSVNFGQQAVDCEESHSPDEDLLDKFNLGKENSKKVKPPRVKEAKAILECRFREFLEPEDSDHVIAVGEVVHAECEAGEDGLPDLEKINPLLHDQGGKFREIGKEIILERKK